MIEDIIGTEPAVMVYFYNDKCNVCREMRPKVRNLVNINFPKLRLIELNVSEEPAVASLAGVYSAPTIIVWFDSKEYIRTGKHMSVSELGEKISRYYNMIF